MQAGYTNHVIFNFLQLVTNNMVDTQICQDEATLVGLNSQY